MTLYYIRITPSRCTISSMISCCTTSITVLPISKQIIEQIRHHCWCARTTCHTSKNIQRSAHSHSFPRTFRWCWCKCSRESIPGSTKRMMCAPSVPGAGSPGGSTIFLRAFPPGLYLKLGTMRCFPPFAISPQPPAPDLQIGGDSSGHLREVRVRGIASLICRVCGVCVCGGGGGGGGWGWGWGWGWGGLTQVHRYMSSVSAHCWIMHTPGSLGQVSWL